MVNMEEKVHSGACQCKSVKYQFKGEPLTCYTCHCSDCQTATGSAFTLSMLVNAEDIEVTEGVLKQHVFDHNGHEVARNHCDQCGSALWISAVTAPKILALKPGTFNNTRWFTPIAHLWLRSAQPWIKLNDDIVQYETQPSMDELISLWQKERSD